jgi:hypothetical protein
MKKRLLLYVPLDRALQLPGVHLDAVSYESGLARRMLQGTVYFLPICVSLRSSTTAQIDLSSSIIALHSYRSPKRSLVHRAVLAGLSHHVDSGNFFHPV